MKISRPGMEISQPLWATCSNAQNVLMVKAFSPLFNWNFPVCILCCCIMPCPRVSLGKVESWNLPSSPQAAPTSEKSPSSPQPCLQHPTALLLGWLLQPQDSSPVADKDPQKQLSRAMSNLGEKSQLLQSSEPWLSPPHWGGGSGLWAAASCLWMHPLVVWVSTCIPPTPNHRWHQDRVRKKSSYSIPSPHPVTSAGSSAQAPSTRVNPKALAQMGHQQHLLSHCRDRSVLEKPGHHCALNPSPGHPPWPTQSWSTRGTKASDVEGGEMPPVAPSTNQSDPG